MDTSYIIRCIHKNIWCELVFYLVVNINYVIRNTLIHFIHDVNLSLFDVKTSYTWCKLLLTWCQTFITWCQNILCQVNLSLLSVKHSLLDVKTSYTWCDLVLTWCQTFIKCQCILYMMWTYPYLESNNHHPWCQNIMYIMWTCPWCLCSLLDVNAFYKCFELVFTWCLTILFYFRLSSGCRPNAYFVAGVKFLSCIYCHWRQYIWWHLSTETYNRLEMLRKNAIYCYKRNRQI